MNKLLSFWTNLQTAVAIFIIFYQNWESLKNFLPMCAWLGVLNISAIVFLLLFLHYSQLYLFKNSWQKGWKKIWIFPLFHFVSKKEKTHKTRRKKILWEIWEFEYLLFLSLWGMSSITLTRGDEEKISSKKVTQVGELYLKHYFFFFKGCSVGHSMG